MSETSAISFLGISVQPSTAKKMIFVGVAILATLLVVGILAHLKVGAFQHISTQVANTLFVCAAILAVFTTVVLRAASKGVPVPKYADLKMKWGMLFGDSEQVRYVTISYLNKTFSITKTVDGKNNLYKVSQITPLFGVAVPAGKPQVDPAPPDFWCYLLWLQDKEKCFIPNPDSTCDLDQAYFAFSIDTELYDQLSFQSLGVEQYDKMSHKSPWLHTVTLEELQERAKDPNAATFLDVFSAGPSHLN